MTIVETEIGAQLITLKPILVRLLEVVRKGIHRASWLGFEFELPRRPTAHLCRCKESRALFSSPSR